MIKLPNVIVIYPQKKSVPGYLLCWIPAEEYATAVVDAEKRSDHERLDPQGIEIELSEEGLEEAGVKLDATPDELRRAYLVLWEGEVVPESGMVELVSLQGYLKEEGRYLEEAAGEEAEAMFSFDTGRSRPRRNELLSKFVSAPPMTEGDDASQVYRRLDVRQRSSNQDERGR
jgi:hypothetical protein